MTVTYTQSSGQCWETISDIHKDAYGHRPTTAFYQQWSAASDDQKLKIWDGLFEALQRANAEEAIRQRQAIADLEERIKFMQSTICGCTRRDAIRYLIDVYQTDGDVGYLEWHLEVPYGHLTKEFGLYIYEANETKIGTLGGAA